MKLHETIIAGLGGALLLVAGAALTPAAQSAEFFAGKTLTMVNNYPPGGASDTEGRIFARHLTRHIPGNPNIVFKNVAGAGGLKGFNWLGEVAKQGRILFCCGWRLRGAWHGTGVRREHG